MPPSIPPSPAGGRGGERANQSFGLPSDSSTSVSHSNGQAQLYKLNPLCAILSASFAQQVLRWLVHQHTISCSSISSLTGGPVARDWQILYDVCVTFSHLRLCDVSFTTFV